MKKQIAFLVTLAFLCASTLVYAGGQKEDAMEKSSVPQRIVSLSPAATEILFAVGAEEQIVSRTDFCNFPEEAANIPSLGGFDGKTFSLEAVIAQNPDLVYATRGLHDHLEAPLAEHGITVYMSEAQSLDAVFTEIEYIAKLTGNVEQGQKVVDEMQAIIDEVVAVAKIQTPPDVYWEVWNAPYMSVGNSSFINELIELAGGNNIFSDIDEGYPVVSEESIILRNPDVILAPNDAGTTADIITSRTGWDGITAVQNMGIYFLPGDIVSRPGPRSALAVQLIFESIFPK